MNVKQLITDDDAVSPVIGVILMVAITVILAAVIGAFVLNIGGSQESAPQATIDFTDHVVDSETAVEVTHQSGDPLQTDDVNLRVGSGYDEDITAEMTAGTSIWVWDDSGISQATSKPSSTSASISDQVQLVWSSPSSDKTSVIAEHTPS